MAHYRLDGPGSNHSRIRYFSSKPSIAALPPNEPPVQCTLRLFTGSNAVGARSWPRLRISGGACELLHTPSCRAQGHLYLLPFPECVHCAVRTESHTQSRLNLTFSLFPNYVNQKDEQAMSAILQSSHVSALPLPAGVSNEYSTSDLHPPPPFRILWMSPSLSLPSNRTKLVRMFCSVFVRRIRDVTVRPEQVWTVRRTRTRNITTPVSKHKLNNFQIKMYSAFNTMTEWFIVNSLSLNLKRTFNGIKVFRMHKYTYNSYYDEL